MENSKPETRLFFQGSIPFEVNADAETFYNKLKEIIKTQNPNATFNGQIMLMLEPCCKKAPTPTSGPLPFARPERS